MEIEEIIEKIKQNPDEYLEVQTLEYIEHLLLGVIRARYESNDVFHAKFYFFVAAWANIEVHSCPWHKIIYNKTSSEEEAISVFFKLSDDFFKSYHNGDLL